VLEWARNEPAPDVVMVSEPALFYGDAALRTVRRNGATLVLDTLDLWPEMFHIALPSRLQPYGRLIFAPLYSRRARTFARADGILAASRNYRDLSKQLAPHLPDALIQTVYFGVHLNEFRAAMLRDGPLPPELRTPREPNEIRLVFASTLGSNYDVQTILDTAVRLTNSDIPFRLYIAGTGPLESMIAERTRQTELHRVHFLGNPDADAMARIYAHCDIGISGYVAGSRVTMPIKAFHYCAAGLAVVNSLDGEFQDLLTSYGAGVRYRSGDAGSLADELIGYARNPARLASARAASLTLGTEFDVARGYPRAVELVERAASARALLRRAGQRA
jgi:glycosyltransferase involved in cell wall biosynthesis